MGSWIKASTAGHKHSPLPSLAWMVMERTTVRSCYKIPEQQLHRGFLLLIFHASEDEHNKMLRIFAEFHVTVLPF